MRDRYTITLSSVDVRTVGAARNHWQEDHREHDLARDLVPVRPESPRRLRQIVLKLARYFQREFGYDSVQWAVDGEDGRVVSYLWCERPEESPVIGAACFRWREWTDHPPGWALQWVWLHPFERRRGHLRRAWPFFSTVHGDFHVEPPVSPAMQAFIRSMGSMPASTRAFISFTKTNNKGEQMIDGSLRHAQIMITFAALKAANGTLRPTDATPVDIIRRCAAQLVERGSVSQKFADMVMGEYEEAWSMVAADDAAKSAPGSTTP